MNLFRKMIQRKDNYSRLTKQYQKPKYKTQNVFVFEGMRFGIEIEFNCDKTEMEIIEYLKSKGYISNSKIVDSKNRVEKRDYKDWLLCKESSENDELTIKCDKELISPIFIDEPKTWTQIRDVLTSIKNNFNGKVNEVCSIHIHVDRNCFMKSPSDFNKLHELYVFLEPLILCIAAGDDEFVSSIRLFHYSAVETQEEYFLQKEVRDVHKRKEIDEAEGFDETTENNIIHFFGSRFHSINYATLTTNYSTVEFRVFNGTLNENVIQTYLILINHILSNIGVDIENVNAYYRKKGKYYLDARYIEKCYSLLKFDNDKRSAMTDILMRNKFMISDEAIRALEGRYKEDEIKRIIEKN